MTESPTSSPLRLGAFVGVFTPTLLTILGVIMYLRFGWVVANAGLTGTFAIVMLASSITFLTALSMSQLATSMRVGAGGAYFLISRSFGLEIGGAIGIPLYVSQVLSLTLYAYGLAESCTLFVDLSPRALQAIACLVIVVVTLVAAKSTRWTLQAQIPILGLIVLSVAALLVGAERGPSQVAAWGPWTDVGFWAVFAVFFPAVTGVLTGLSLSGDLADPSRSIPRGVVAAVVLGTAVYLIVPIALASSAGPQVLRTDSLAWTRIAVGGAWLVLPGMFGAVLSSAFGSILSAPRTLLALAADGLAPKPLAQVEPGSGEPITGLRVSGVLALIAAAMLPDLNAAASWVTVFFLTTYGALNAVSALEGLIGDPSFRPTIAIPWPVSAVGAAACFVTMFLIHPLACLVALLVEGLIFVFLSRRSLESTWGDARGGLLLSGARYALLRLRNSRFDPRSWRPHLLIVATDLAEALPSIALAQQFGQHRGIVTVNHMVPGELRAETDVKALLRRDEELLKQAGLGDVFAELAVVPDPASAAVVIPQANGIAGLQSNTVLLPMRRDDAAASLSEGLRLSAAYAALHLSTLLHFPGGEHVRAGHASRRVVVWWAGRHNNGDLMLLLAHLLRVSPEWKGARLELKTVASSDDEALSRRDELFRLTEDVRIDAQCEVVRRENGDTAEACVARHSVGADLVLLGFRIPEPEESQVYANRLAAWVAKLPQAILVHNASEFRGKLV